MGAASFFPTTKIIQRAVAARGDAPVAPMSEKLAARMTSVINSELLALLSIPLAATMMSRAPRSDNHGPFTPRTRPA